MKDDYLWDGSGEPDPEIQKLETALGRFRHNQPAPAFDQLAQIPQVKVRKRFFNLRFSFQLAAVAATLVIAATVFYFLRRPMPGGESGPAWDVARLAGAPKIGWKVIGADAGVAKLSVGQTLVTDSSSRASITLEETGRVEVDAGSRLRLVANGPGRKRLSLERGTIHATIWAPPGEFVVDTPSAVAVDLGCVYTLHVDDSGAGPNPSFPLALFARHVRRSVRVRPTLKMPLNRFVTRCLDSTLNRTRPLRATPCSAFSSWMRARTMRSHSGICSPASVMPIAPASMTASPRSLRLLQA